MFIAAKKRTNVTIDDRRAVIVAGRSRKPADIAAVPHEQFARNMLKDRMGWPHRDPAPESVKAAAKELAATLSGMFKKQLDNAESQAAAAIEKAQNAATAAQGEAQPA